MSEQIPTIGRIVLYTLTEVDAQRINSKREASATYIKAFHENPTKHGEMQHSGNPVEPGMVFPLIITRVWGITPTSAVNGQVLLDGNDSLWVTSTSAQGKSEYSATQGHFTWPTRE
ncbi:hypothetical protein [Cryobacterium fucosi]|uniref:Uncharacterized protein n=1 Tax=Cryobacterium fucosi TaxID=1259157 RepID=A0A4R9B2R5_9MICO|nr:hypothetical protein [Cryobacterium fucosi]TFD74725.1 hypothetical protein E3T48_12430 [Cryobacterium fucosi]